MTQLLDSFCVLMTHSQLRRKLWKRSRNNRSSILMTNSPLKTRQDFILLSTFSNSWFPCVHPSLFLINTEGQPGLQLKHHNRMKEWRNEEELGGWYQGRMQWRESGDGKLLRLKQLRKLISCTDMHIRYDLIFKSSSASVENTYSVFRQCNNATFQNQKVLNINNMFF